MHHGRRAGRVGLVELEAELVRQRVEPEARAAREDHRRRDAAPALGDALELLRVGALDDEGARAGLRDVARLREEARGHRALEQLADHVVLAVLRAQAEHVEVRVLAVRHLALQRLEVCVEGEDGVDDDGRARERGVRHQVVAPLVHQPKLRALHTLDDRRQRLEASVAVLERDHGGGLVEEVGGHWVGALIEQQLRHIVMPATHGQHERGRSAVLDRRLAPRGNQGRCASVDVCSGLESSVGHFHIAYLRREEQVLRRAHIVRDGLCGAVAMSARSRVPKDVLRFVKAIFSPIADGLPNNARNASYFFSRVQGNPPQRQPNLIRRSKRPGDWLHFFHEAF